ncbi:MAG TPA: FecR domain-containing protein, partial [Patescibacteria group bacterium]|nr:FecR domain-containing protein [Patescibacteria group bacterium]
GDGRAVVPEPAVYRPYIPDSFASSTSFQPAAEQDVVRLWGDSLLGIDKLTNVQTGADAVNETELDLKKGHITATVKKLSAASKYEVKFVNGVAGVRGTVFDLRAQGIIKVYIGSMVVAWVDPVTKNVTTQIVMGGQAYDTAHRLISILSPESMTELAQVSSTLLLTQPFSVPGTLAVDRTAIGMSPVGANPSSIPVHPNSGGGVVITTYTGPPPPIVRP